MLQLALLYGVQKKSDKAIETYTALLALDANDWRALRGRGDAYLNIGKQAAAIADYEKATKLQPEDEGILNNLAWVLATSPDAKLRDGHRAIELATAACKLTEYKRAYILSTLAAAYAETGDFATAVKWSTKAVELGEKDQIEELKKDWPAIKRRSPGGNLMPEEKPAEKKEAAKKEATTKKKP